MLMSVFFSSSAALMSQTRQRTPTHTHECRFHRLSRWGIPKRQLSHKADKGWGIVHKLFINFCTEVSAAVEWKQASVLTLEFRGRKQRPHHTNQRRRKDSGRVNGKGRQKRMKGVGGWIATKGNERVEEKISMRRKRWRPEDGLGSVVKMCGGFMEENLRASGLIF